MKRLKTVTLIGGWIRGIEMLIMKWEYWSGLQVHTENEIFVRMTQK